MFRELLESNGIKIEVVQRDNLVWHSIKVKCFQITFGEVKWYTNIAIIGSVKTKEQAIEQACMQYCIENGVKLEWLCQDVDGDYMKRILDDEWIDSATFSPATPLEAWLEYHLPRIMPNSRKLIFAILGHDIKIIAT
jgi:hypothetical protein